MRCLERYGGGLLAIMIIALLSTALTASAATKVHVFTGNSDLVTEDSKARDVDRGVIAKHLERDKNILLVSTPTEADFSVEVLSRGRPDQTTLTDDEKLFDQRYTMVRAVIRTANGEVVVERQSPYYSMAGIEVANVIRRFAKDNGSRFAQRE